MLSQASVAHHPSMSIPPSATVDDGLAVVSSSAHAEQGTWSPWPTHPVDPSTVPAVPSSLTHPAMSLVWYNTATESIPKLMSTKLYVTEPMNIRKKEEVIADIPPYRYYPPSPPPSEPRASSNPLSSDLSSFSSMPIESCNLDTESDDEDREEEEDASSDDSNTPPNETMVYEQDPADSPQSDTDSISSPSVCAPRIITPAGSKPRDAKPQRALQVPKIPSPTPARSGSSRRAATRARIATKKVQQLESEDEIDDDSEYEQDQTHPHPVVQTIDELPSEDDHQVDDEYDELDDDTAPKKRKIKPSNKSSKKRKITERFRCTIPGCTKTFTRKNDVTRHIRASGAHPDYQEQSDNVKCKICGIDLSRSDARLRHERTYACGKRNVQQSRDKANAKNRATTA
ncbi:hypothetical protein IW261DRAFT_782037 [Armillaria novae-zelandiae]|uniref:C2H2-type domain-containing protein n=1 Tax=Armillaria novae-zelandiae TaxID=153914 RepID=A0AA39PKY4_9AGAR|nr:hypothetical protein IW261DRAFT_782037 [Armillaria novae-zelandiae]